MERKIHDARARPGFVTSMINMTSAEGLSRSRKKRFSEQSAEAQLASAAPSHQRGMRVESARSRSWNREPRAREIATAAPHRTARDRVRSRRE